MTTKTSGHSTNLYSHTDGTAAIVLSSWRLARGKFLPVGSSPRSHAALAGTPDFHKLVQTMQRARRIIPPGTAPHYDPTVLTEPAEIRLHDTLDKTRTAIEEIIDLDHYTATTDLTHAVTEFFDQIYVMDNNPQHRTTRLSLLAAITELGERTLAWEHLHT